MLIIDMPMPLRCPCELAEDNNGWYAPCFAYYGEPEREKEFDRCVEHGTRPDWCPIKGELVRCGECIMGFEENGEKYCRHTPLRGGDERSTERDARKVWNRRVEAWNRRANDERTD